MRKFGYIFSTVVTLGLGGCGYFFPGFDGIFGLHSYIHNIPVDRVSTELECELRDFVRKRENNDVLDPTKFAGISIKFQTDQSGTFQYVGINLSKVGLAAVENLISVSNKIPSLQAKVKAKTTASSQLEFSIPQNLNEVKGIPGLNAVKGCDRLRLPDRGSPSRIVFCQPCQPDPRQHSLTFKVASGC